MSWILITILLTIDGVSTETVDVYDNMDSCFDARDKLVEEWGRPIINYQILCVGKNF